MRGLPILCAVAGLVVGAGTVLLVPSLQPSQSKLAGVQQDLENKTSEIKKLQSRAAEIEVEKKVGEEEQEGLRRKIGELEGKLASANAAPASAPAPSNAVANATANFLKQQNENKILALKNRLNLTPEQEAELRRHFEEEAKWQQKVAAAFMSGNKLSEAELKEGSLKAGSLEEKLKKMLSPEQMKSYQDFQKEEKSQQQELIAHHGMNEISSLFPLDEDQKDKVYGILYEQGDFKPVVKEKDPLKASSDYAQQRHENLKTKLKDVLTPEQLEVWSKRDEEKMRAQQEMVQRFTPK